MDRCDILNNPCGKHGKCVAGASFTSTCDCDDGYETKAGVCVKDEDDDLALKVCIIIIINYCHKNQQQIAHKIYSKQKIYKYQIVRVRDIWSTLAPLRPLT